MTKVVSLGAGGPQEIEVAQVSGANWSVQFNNAGQQAGAAQTSIDLDGNLRLTMDNQPIKPASTAQAVVHLRQRGQRTALAWYDFFGMSLSSQVSLVSNSVWFIGATASGQSLNIFNVTTASAGTGGITSVASGVARDHITEKARFLIASTTVAGNLGYVHGTGGKAVFINQAITPASPSLGVARGFTAVFKFNREEPTIVTAARIFLGMSAVITTPTNVNPTTQLNTIGIYKDTTDTNYKLFSSGSSAGVVIDLGASFPCNTRADCFELVLHSPTNSGQVFYEVVCTNTGATASGEFSAANLPNTYQFLTPRIWITNNTAAVATQLALHYAYGDVPR